MRAVVIGLDHWVQRNQDAEPSRNAARKVFGSSIKRLIEREGIQGLAEEAGNDQQVAANLQREEDNWAPFEGRPPHRIEPVQPIAKQVVDQTPACRYIDIHPNRVCANNDEYEEQMFSRLLAGLGNAVCIIVLCGEYHRESFSRRLRQNSWDVESHNLDWLLGLVR